MIDSIFPFSYSDGGNEYSLLFLHEVVCSSKNNKTRFKYDFINNSKIIYHNYLATPYVLHAADIKIEEGITYLPLYMTGLL